MKIRTSEILGAIERLKKDAGEPRYIEVCREGNRLEISARDGKALEHRVTLYESDSNKMPKLTTETTLLGFK